jgi:hypothetical protein
VCETYPFAFRSGKDYPGITSIAVAGWLAPAIGGKGRRDSRPGDRWQPGRRVRHDLGMGSPHPRAEPFRAAVDIEASGDLALRLGTARLGGARPGAARPAADGGTWERGVPGDWLARLIEDWRAFDPLILQTRLDRLTHLRAEVDGISVHLVHGGHFPAVAEPRLLADRLREVFRPCRGS